MRRVPTLRAVKVDPSLRLFPVSAAVLGMVVIGAVFEAGGAVMLVVAMSPATPSFTFAASASPLTALPVGLPPARPPGGSNGGASLGTKPFSEAHAWISVPSTVKCSSDSSGATFGCASKAAGIGRVVPHPVIDAEADKPVKQPVVIELLHQLTLEADRVERLDPRATQQLLGRDRRATERRIYRIELVTEVSEDLVDDRADETQRMARGYPLLQVDIRKQ